MYRSRIPRELKSLMDGTLSRISAEGNFSKNAHHPRHFCFFFPPKNVNHLVLHFLFYHLIHLHGTVAKHLKNIPKQNSLEIRPLASKFGILTTPRSPERAWKGGRASIPNVSVMRLVVEITKGVGKKRGAEMVENEP